MSIITTSNNQICVALKPASSCPSMEALCGGQLCTYAIFNTPLNNLYKCCPVRSWMDPPPTR